MTLDKKSDLIITPTADLPAFKRLPPGDVEFYAAAASAPILMDIPGKQNFFNPIQAFYITNSFSKYLYAFLLFL